MTQERKALGAAGEAAASRFLRRAGYRIIARNYSCPRGELDIVARLRGLVVFVEVKTRVTDAHANPLDSVTREKRRRLAAAAKQFLRDKQLLDSEYRFDVVTVIWGTGRKPEKIEHHPGAFSEGRR